MIPKKLVRLVLVGVFAFVGVACGGGGDDDGDTTAATGKEPAASTTPTTAGADLPQFVQDFQRVCTTGVGFKGAAAYEAGPGVHPIIFFEDHRGEDIVESSGEFPAGWVVKADDDFDDNSEFEPVQLIGCEKRTKTTPTGKKCEFEDDGEKITLELVNATYEVKVHSAVTGEVVDTKTIETAETECPFIAAFQKGDTTWVAEPDDDDHINALKPTVAP